MDDKNELKPGATEAPASATRAPHAGGGGAEARPEKRFSTKRKLAAVQRLIGAIDYMEPHTVPDASCPSG